MSYWNGNGTHQDKIEALQKLIPLIGELKGKHNAALERLRKGINAYYDLFNNGGGNRPQLITSVFGNGPSHFHKTPGVLMSEYAFLVTEPVMDKLVLDAFSEQQEALRKITA